MSTPGSSSSGFYETSKGPSWRQWSHIAALLLIGVELGWVLPWYRTVTQISYGTSVWVMAFVLAGVMLASYLVTQFMEEFRLLRSMQLVLLAILLGISLILGGKLLLNSPVREVIEGLVNLETGAGLMVFAVLWLWWRGITLGREPVRPVTAWRRFELGMLLLMAHILVTSRLGEEPPGLGWFVLFLFVGLMAVIAARVSYVGIIKGLTKNPFDRRWLVSTSTILGGTIAVAAILGSLLTGQYSMVLEWLAETIKLLVAVTLFIIGLPALILSLFLGPVVMPALMRLAATPTPQDPDSVFIPDLSPDAAVQARPLSPLFQSLLYWGVIIVLVVVLLIRFRRGRGPRRTVSDEPESILESGDARRLMQKALQDAADDLAARLRPRQRQLAAERIRQIYTQLLDLCVELNRPRPSAKTPLEFLPVMRELFSGMRADLDLITQAYLRVRYGEFPETKDEIELIEMAWQRVDEEGQRLKKTGRFKEHTAEGKRV